MYLLKLNLFSKIHYSISSIHSIFTSEAMFLFLDLLPKIPIYLFYLKLQFPPNYSPCLYLSKLEEGADLARHFNLDKPEAYAEMGPELEKEFQTAKLKEKSDDSLGNWVKNGYSNNKGNFCEYFD